MRRVCLREDSQEDALHDRAFWLRAGDPAGRPGVHPLTAAGSTATHRRSWQWHSPPNGRRPEPQALEPITRSHRLDPKWADPACGAHSPRRPDDARTRGSRGEPLDGVLARGRGNRSAACASIAPRPSWRTALGQVPPHGMNSKGSSLRMCSSDDVGNVRPHRIRDRASRLPHECRRPRRPRVIAGTLVLHGAEQTGRMNRSIDPEAISTLSASTFYEMQRGPSRLQRARSRWNGSTATSRTTGSRPANG